jgi:hypothetical protein
MTRNDNAQPLIVGFPTLTAFVASVLLFFTEFKIT